MLGLERDSNKETHLSPSHFLSVGFSWSCGLVGRFGVHEELLCALEPQAGQQWGSLWILGPMSPGNWPCERL
jgi:hypothetical protein